MKQLKSNIIAGLVVGCVFFVPGFGAEPETPPISAQIDELFSN